MLLLQGVRTAIDEEVNRTEHNRYGLLVLVIMSRGEKKDIIIGSNNQSISLVDLKNLLSKTNFPEMKGKPKLIVVQACWGGKFSGITHLEGI